jgi:hypothetical protein
MTGHPAPEEFGEPDLEVAGFQIWVHGRQFPHSMDSSDGNWLYVTAHAGTPGASVWASGAILEVTNLALWADRCAALASGEAQQAELAPSEPELHVLIRRIDGLSHFAMRVQITPDYRHQEHTFEFAIDQTHLRETTRRCRSIAGAYPVRGEAGKVTLTSGR